MTQAINASGRDNVIVQVQGDGNTVVTGLAHLTLTRRLRRRVLQSDLSLLDPFARFPLIGRESDLANLWQWLRSPASISTRVLVGAGGSGKTRLGVELCDQAEGQRWDAGFLSPEELGRFRAQQNLASWGWQRPTLAVIDDAGAQSELLHDWLKELADNPGDPDRPFRLLLLERHGGLGTGWWERAFGRGGDEALALQSLLDPALPVQLPRLIDPGDRLRIFAETFKQAGGPATGAVIDNPQFELKLAELSWGGEPLFLLMAAMTAAEAGVPTALALGRTSVAFHVAENEARRIAGFGRNESEQAFLPHLAAFTTLCQGFTRAGALEVIEEERSALSREAAGDRASIYTHLRHALPGDGDGIAAVLPDVVGEALMLRTLGEGYAEAALASVGRAAGRAWSEVVQVIVRTVQDFGTQGLAWLEPVVRLAEGSADWHKLEELVGQMPPQTLVLRETAAQLADRLVEVVRTQVAAGHADQRFLLAESLNKLSNRLSDLGRREAALAAIEEAVAIVRALALENPDAFRPALGAALNNLSNCRSVLGRREEALAAIEEAVTIRRESAAARPDAFRPVLAASLNNLSVQLGGLGQWEAGLAASEEAVTIWRELALNHPEDFRHDLAKSLHTLSQPLGALGQPEAALSAIEEAVIILRELAAARPDAFRSDLARSLNDLSGRLDNLDQRGAALAAIEEAVTTLRELALERPDAFRSDLATSLNNLSHRLSDMDRREEALAAIEEAVTIRRALALENPDAFRDDLAASLNNLSNVLGGLERREKALAAIEEAEGLYRKLAFERPDAFRPDLVMALNNLSNRLSDLGRREEALAAIEEAMTIQRELALHRPETFRPDLARTLTGLSDRLSDLGRREEALAAIEEAVTIRRELAFERPHAFRLDLAVALNNLSIQLKASGQPEAALAARGEAEEIAVDILLRSGRDLGD